MLRFAAHTAIYFNLAPQMRLFCPFMAFPGLRRSSLPGVIDIEPFQGFRIDFSIRHSIFFNRFDSDFSTAFSHSHSLPFTQSPPLPVSQSPILLVLNNQSYSC